MISEQCTWLSLDNIKLAGRCWRPEGEPAAVICLVHGLGEHTGRYEHVAERLAREGYALLAYDLRGHGSSGGQRCYCPDFESLMQDIDLLLEEADRRFFGLPKILYGHSLGGILVLNYSLRRKPDLAGVIATSSGLITAIQEQRGKVLLARALGSLLPRLSIKSGLDARGLSRDEEVVRAYLSDPLVHDRMTARMGKELLAAIDYAFTHANEFQLPLLLMHGSKDAIAYPSGSEKFSSSVTCDCTLKIWPDMYHELHNEIEKEDVFAYLIDWLREKTGRPIPGQSRSGMGKFDPVEQS